MADYYLAGLPAWFMRALLLGTIDFGLVKLPCCERHPMRSRYTACKFREGIVKVYIAHNGLSSNGAGGASDTAYMGCSFPQELNVAASNCVPLKLLSFV